MSGVALQARALTLRRGPMVVLDRVSLVLRPGEVTCLLGTSGSGKSALVAMLAGAAGPSDGEILLDEQVQHWRGPASAQALGIGAAFQDQAVIEGLGIARNLLLGSEPVRGIWPLRWLDRRRAHWLARERLAALGLDDVDPEAPAGSLDLVGRRLVAVARAIQQGTRFLLLDEPTAGLPLPHVAKVVAAVRAARERGVAVLLATQNVQHAWPIGDRFGVLYRGRMLGSIDRIDTRREELFGLITGGDEAMEIDAELGIYQPPPQPQTIVSNAASALAQPVETLDLQQSRPPPRPQPRPAPAPAPAERPAPPERAAPPPPAPRPAAPAPLVMAPTRTRAPRVLLASRNEIVPAATIALQIQTPPRPKLRAR